MAGRAARAAAGSKWPQNGFAGRRSTVDFAGLVVRVRVGLAARGGRYSAFIFGARVLCILETACNVLSLQTYSIGDLNVAPLQTFFKIETVLDSSQ